MFNPYGRQYWRSEKVELSDRYDYWWEEVRHPASPDEANLIGSLTGSGRHAPALDLDLGASLVPLLGEYSLLAVQVVPAQRNFRQLEAVMVALGLAVSYVPHPGLDEDPEHIYLMLRVPAHLQESSTAGHHHLYLNHELSWADYVRLLRLLCRCGIIEQGFYNLARKRRQTFLRPPGVTKQSGRELAVLQSA